MSKNEYGMRKQVPSVMSLACLVFLRKRLYLLPILTAVFILLSFFVSYGISVSLGHTEPDFPYISHTAVEEPERCVFGQLINLGALLLGMNILVRYLYVKEVYIRERTIVVSNNWHRGNIAALVFGVLSAFGLSMVANFQTGSQRVPHYIGAFLAFGLGMVYAWIQTTLSWKIQTLRRPGSQKLFWARVLNSIVMSILLSIFIASKSVYKYQQYKNMGTKWDKLRTVYLTSTISEWLLASSVLTYILTYTMEFMDIRLENPRVILRDRSRHSENAILGSTVLAVQTPTSRV
ncbi:hypothetical protein ScPMuIL_016212 [Solemya velum]